MIGVISMQALRHIQSRYHSPAKPFKAVPDGFAIDFVRKVFLAGDKE